MLIDRTMIKSRPARASDIQAYFSKNAPQTVRARALEIDGKVVGIAGYYIQSGVAVLFSDNSECIPKIRIWREAKAIMDSLTIPAICFGSKESGPFLERLGWHFAGETDVGDLYKWQP